MTGSRVLGLLLAAVVLAAGTGGALGALATGALDRRDSRSLSAPSSTATAAPSGDAAAFYAGRALRGNGDGAIPLARAQRLAAEIPAGATVDRSTHTLRFANGDVSFVALASPPGHDMTFQTAGMTDPTIEVPRGAQVSVRFINGDSDMAHMWLLAESVPPAGSSPAANAVIAGGRPLGDPTSAGQPEETIAFSAPAPGTYHYYCAFPGHAMQGMQGRLLVENS